MSPLPVDLGEGALLRRLRIEDLEVIWATVDAARERLDPWMPWISGTRTIDDQRGWLESVVEVLVPADLDAADLRLDHV